MEICDETYSEQGLVTFACFQKMANLGFGNTAY